MREHYQLLESLGEGGFGEVYRARRTDEGGLEREVAVKLLRGGSALECLRQEARHLAAVRHRAIVHVERLVYLDGHPAMVMEYVDGAGLESLLQLGEVPPRPAVSIAREIAGALYAACGSPDAPGLIHRDIKPANIRLTPRGEVKLLDFGTAILRGEDASGALTEAYAAPERLRGEAGTAAVDVYALGAVLYELLTARTFGPTSPRERAHAHRSRAALRALADHPESLQALIGELFSFSPQDRPDARAVERRCAELEPLLEGPQLLDWAEAAVPLLRIAPAPETSERQWTEASLAVPIVPPSASSAAPERHQRWPMVLGGLLGLAGAGALVLSRLPSPEPTPLPPPIEASPTLVILPPDRPVAESVPPPPVSETAQPPPAPRVAPPAPEPMVSVRADTLLAVRLERDGVSHALPAELPEGTYIIHTSFPGLGEMTAGAVTLAVGEPITIRCDEGLTRCNAN